MCGGQDAAAAVDVLEEPAELDEEDSDEPDELDDEESELDDDEESELAEDPDESELLEVLALELPERLSVR